eukprot:1844773-Pyramimonas_sp.AAC.1
MSVPRQCDRLVRFLLPAPSLLPRLHPNQQRCEREPCRLRQLGRRFDPILRPLLHTLEAEPGWHKHHTTVRDPS